MIFAENGYYIISRSVVPCQILRISSQLYVGCIEQHMGHKKVDCPLCDRKVSANTYKHTDKQPTVWAVSVLCLYMLKFCRFQGQSTALRLLRDFMLLQRYEFFPNG